MQRAETRKLGWGQCGRDYELFPRIHAPFWSRFCTEVYRMATQDQTGRDGAGATQRTPANLGVQEISSEAALVQSSSQTHDPLGPSLLDPVIRQIPVEIDVAVPIRKFRVRNLLALATGQVIATRWLDGEDMPLAARGAQLAWTEFEVIDQKLAVRITRLV